MSSISDSKILPVAVVTHPSVIVNLEASKLALPKSACAIPVAFALVVAAFKFSLLCAICAAPATSLLLIAPAVIPRSTVTCRVACPAFTRAVVIVISLPTSATPLAHSSTGPSTTLPCLPPGAVSTSAAGPSAGLPSLNTPVNTVYVISTMSPSVPVIPST